MADIVPEAVERYLARGIADDNERVSAGPQLVGASVPLRDGLSIAVKR